MTKLVSKQSKDDYMQTSTGKVANFQLPEVEVTAKSPTGDDWKDRNLYQAYKGRRYISEGRQKAEPLAFGLAGLTATPGITALAPAVSATLNNPYVNAVLTADGVRNALSGEGVQKTYRLAKEGDYWGATKSGVVDALDLYGGANLFKGVAKAGNKWARARILSKAIDYKSTTYLNNTPQAYKKLSSKQLPKDQNLLYHQNYGTSKLTDKGLIPGKSNNGGDYLWWKEGSQYGNFPERNVYTIPKHKADIVTRGNSKGINPNGDYPLTKEVPLEELTEYSINPMTYGFEKRIFIKPNKPSKRLIMDGKTIPIYFGKKYSVNDVVNPDGTINVRTAQRIQQETAKHYGVPPMQKRTENPVWHKDDPNTFFHTKKVTKNAWELPVPSGYTKQDQMIAAVGHDFGKIVAGDGHAQAGAGLLKQIFPDLTDDQFKAIYEHMNPIEDIQGNLSKYTKYADIGGKPKQSINSQDFFDESNPQNLSPVSIKNFFKNDVEKRTHILDNPAFIPNSDNWYKYELHDFQNGLLGDYTPSLDRVRIARTLDPVTSHTTKVHEFRHKLESHYPLNYQQRKHLDEAYRIFSTKEPRIANSRSLAEKTATNTELRAKLYHKFRQTNGRNPRDIREMDNFIDNLSKSEIRDALRSINGYGQDYVESILSKIESAKQEGLPKEAIQDGVNKWVENVKQALKYVPTTVGVSLIPKNNNTQLGN